MEPRPPLSPLPPPTAEHKLYGELARWWPLFSPPSEYVEEAEELLEVLRTAAQGPAHTLLELGSGGGSLAFHLKPHYQLTLTDLSPQMLDISRRSGARP